MSHKNLVIDFHVLQIQFHTKNKRMYSLGLNLSFQVLK
jgi:hypothetical protein